MHLDPSLDARLRQKSRDATFRAYTERVSIFALSIFLLSKRMISLAQDAAQNPRLED
jgi:hypothetical protein